MHEDLGNEKMAVKFSKHLWIACILGIFLTPRER